MFLLIVYARKPPFNIHVIEKDRGQHFLFHLHAYEPKYEISNNVVCETSNGSDQPMHRCSLITLEYSVTLELLTAKH